MPDNQTTKLKIDVVSDVMCPWCYIGKRNLEAAIESSSDIPVEITWRPYQLDPTLPKEGRDRAEYLNAKFGGPERAREIYSRVNQAGSAVGIDFRFEDIEVSPNTVDAHRLIYWAGGQGAEVQNKVVEALFQHYFLNGSHIGDNAVLRSIAESAGMDGALVAQLLESDADVAEVEQQIAHAQGMGISGVPCFIIDNKYAVMGAQPPEALASAMRQAVGERDKESAFSET